VKKRGKLILAVSSGLGNQMFHYAFYKYLKIAGFNVLLDKNPPPSIYPQHQKHETFRLDYFSLKDIKFAAKEDIFEFIPTEEVYYLPFSKVIKSNHFLTILKVFFFKIKNKFGFTNRWIEWYETGREKDFYRHHLTKNTKAYMAGRYQEYYYLENIRDTLLEDFKFTTEMPEPVKEYFKKITEVNSVAIHIRRGDYSGSKEFDICSIKYYENAVHYILKLERDAVFFIFSDDLEWVKNNVTFIENYRIVDTSQYEKSDYFDLYLMTNCKHNIIPNSTFSWWGAWLNQNPKKIVVCPEKWNGLDFVYTDEICPPEWKRIAVS
jgi:hypothetical protein